ncbi:hypothetical protein DIPPA_19830 [Diplonema papillatum]|nr:hypothetical protein DIPPA_19830 [Diplonema papillatum]
MSPGSDDAETYLPVSVRQLTEALCELRDDTRSREEWKGMVASLQVVVGVYYDGISHRVREHLHEDRRQVTQKRAPADEKSKARGQAAMQDLVTLLDAAQYSPLSQELFDASVEVSYSFPFPCSIQWNRFDGSFLQEYYSRFHNGWYFSPNTAPPSFAESLLVVTRGRRIEERTGQFIWEKVNLLLEICWAKMLRKVGLGQQSARKISFRNKLSSSRVTLEDVAREDGLLNVLFRKVTIREPAFKEVIILFREKASTTAPPPDPKEKLRQFDASMSSSTIVRGSADTLTTPHNRKDKMAPPQTPATPTTMHHTPGAVTIMLFHQVPFGDLDGIFPFKNVLMRPVEILTLLGMILAAVAIIIMTLRSILSGEEEGGNMFLMQLFLLSVSRQAIALFTYITNLKVCLTL